MRGTAHGAAVRWLVAASAVAALIGTSCGGASTASSSTRSNRSGTARPAAMTRTVTDGSLHAVKSDLVDASGRQVRLTGVNWFGLETNAFAPDGLYSRNWQSMLDQIKASGFNTIRLPYSNELLDSGAAPTNINYQLNPDLKGLKGLQLMDKIVEGADKRGLWIILDRHRPSASGQTPLWYTDQVSEDRWVSDWAMLAKHYQNDPSIIGADLHNEPHGTATWGTGDPKTDWRLAAEKAGNAILAANPKWLIIVEGIENYHNDFYWWGGNLDGAAKYPVRLSHPDKLVYSAHDYGPSVSYQSWFGAGNFPQNLAGIWDQHWGYLQERGIAPVLMGEFGGPSVGDDPGGKWQKTLIDYLKTHGLNYTYWSWNPDSGDTGGILNMDWKTVNKAKLDLLSAYQWPAPGQSVAPAHRPSSGSTGGNTGGNSGGGGGTPPAPSIPPTPEPPRPTQPPVNPNLIVPVSPWHAAYLVGYEDGEIRPQRPVSRAEVATIFFRLIEDEYRVSVWRQTNPFPDVNINDWFNNGVSTMANARLMQGDDWLNFRPNDFITRAEFAAVVARFTEMVNDGTPMFEDAAGHWAENYINIVAQMGWIQGYEDGEFRPDALITRAETATIVNRMLNRVLGSPEDLLPNMVRWPDNSDPTEWYYLAMQQATNSADYERQANGINIRWIEMWPHFDFTILERPNSRAEDIFPARTEWFEMK